MTAEELVSQPLEATSTTVAAQGKPWQEDAEESIIEAVTGLIEAGVTQRVAKTP